MYLGIDTISFTVISCCRKSCGGWFGGGVGSGLDDVTVFFLGEDFFEGVGVEAFLVFAAMSGGVMTGAMLVVRFCIDAYN